MSGLVSLFISRPPPPHKYCTQEPRCPSAARTHKDRAEEVDTYATAYMHGLCLPALAKLSATYESHPFSSYVSTHGYGSSPCMHACMHGCMNIEEKSGLSWSTLHCLTGDRTVRPTYRCGACLHRLKEKNIFNKIVLVKCKPSRCKQVRRVCASLLWDVGTRCHVGEPYRSESDSPIHPFPGVTTERPPRHAPAARPCDNPIPSPLVSLAGPRLLPPRLSLPFPFLSPQVKSKQEDTTRTETGLCPRMEPW